MTEYYLTDKGRDRHDYLLEVWGTEDHISGTSVDTIILLSINQGRLGELINKTSKGSREDKQILVTTLNRLDQDGYIKEV